MIVSQVVPILRGNPLACGIIVRISPKIIAIILP